MRCTKLDFFIENQKRTLLAPLMASMNPASPIRLSLPRAEGSLEHAVEQFEKGIGCVLDQVDNARKIILVSEVKIFYNYSL